MIDDDPRVLRARRMKAQGFSGAEIARLFGVSRPTVSRWTVPGALDRERAKARAWKAEHPERVREVERQRHANCRWCAGRCAKDSVQCAACLRATNEVRRSLVEGMWADGWTCREIFADVLGLTVEAVGKYRQMGCDLPYRRSPEQVARIRAGSRRGQGLPA